MRIFCRHDWGETFRYRVGMKTWPPPPYSPNNFFEYAQRFSIVNSDKVRYDCSNCGKIKNCREKVDEAVA